MGIDCSAVVCVCVCMWIAHNFTFVKLLVDVLAFCGWALSLTTGLSRSLIPRKLSSLMIFPWINDDLRRMLSRRWACSNGGTSSSSPFWTCFVISIPFSLAIGVRVLWIRVCACVFGPCSLVLSIVHSLDIYMCGCACLCRGCVCVYGGSCTRWYGCACLYVRVCITMCAFDIIICDHINIKKNHIFKLGGKEFKISKNLQLTNELIGVHICGVK